MPHLVADILCSKTTHLYSPTSDGITQPERSHAPHGQRGYRLEADPDGIRQARVWSVARQFVPAVVRVNVGRSPGCRGVAVPRFIAPAEARVVAAQVELLKGTF
jgi:hypothetical protein